MLEKITIALTVLAVTGVIGSISINTINKDNALKAERQEIEARATYRAKQIKMLHEMQDKLSAVGIESKIIGE